MPRSNISKGCFGNAAFPAQCSFQLHFSYTVSIKIVSRYFTEARTAESMFFSLNDYFDHHANLITGGVMASSGDRENKSSGRSIWSECFLMVSGFFFLFVTQATFFVLHIFLWPLVNVKITCLAVSLLRLHLQSRHRWHPYSMRNKWCRPTQSDYTVMCSGSRTYIWKNQEKRKSLFSRIMNVQLKCEKTTKLRWCFSWLLCGCVQAEPSVIP